MGHPLDDIFYKFKGKGDCICKLIADAGDALTYEMLNNRNPLGLAATPFWKLPIASIEFTGYQNRVLRCMPLIASITVLRLSGRETAQNGKVMHRIKLHRKSKDDPALASLLVSRTFIETLEDVPRPEILCYLEAEAPTGVLAGSLSADITYSGDTTLTAIVAEFVERGWIEDPPVDKYILTEHTLSPVNGYAYDESGWLWRFLVLCDSGNVLETRIAFWPGRWCNEDSGHCFIYYGGGGVDSNNTYEDVVLMPPHGGSLTIPGSAFGPGLCYFMPDGTTGMNVNLVVTVNDAWDRLTEEQKATIQFDIVIYTNISPADGAITLGGVAFTVEALSNINGEGLFSYQLYANQINAATFFADGKTRRIALPAEDYPNPVAWGVVSTPDGLLNIDGVATWYPPAWREHILSNT